MVTAKVNGEIYKVDGLVNRGQWFGDTWLVLISAGFNALSLVVEADNVQAVIDAIGDHPKWQDWLLLDESEFCDYENCAYAGNECKPVTLDAIISIKRCKVNYFAKSVL